MEYCTVLGDIRYDRLQASDCVFTAAMESLEENGLVSSNDCIRYSRIPPAVLALQNDQALLRFPFCTSDQPVFFNTRFAEAITGQPGCGVHHPSGPKSIRFGAEDGGEMGAYHQWLYCLQTEAVKDKLLDYFPVGMEAVLVPDTHLHQLPLQSGG